MEIMICPPRPQPQYVGTERESRYLTRETMYALFPYKWLLISDPVKRNRDGEILGGELMGAYNNREVAWDESYQFRHIAVISSIQEEI